MVKASLIGSILGNILLVLGASFLTGGLRHPRQQFNTTGVRSQATMLILAAVALVSPAVFHHLGGAEAIPREGSLSLAIALVLLATYALGLQTYWNHHIALNIVEPGPVPFARAMGLRMGGLIGNPILSGIVGALGWTIGALLPDRS